jgi:hypothetical protein
VVQEDFVVAFPGTFLVEQTTVVVVVVVAADRTQSGVDAVVAADRT